MSAALGNDCQAYVPLIGRIHRTHRRFVLFSVRGADPNQWLTDQAPVWQRSKEDHHVRESRHPEAEANDFAGGYMATIVDDECGGTLRRIVEHRVAGHHYDQRADERVEPYFATDRHRNRDREGEEPGNVRNDGPERRGPEHEQHDGCPGMGAQTRQTTDQSARQPRRRAALAEGASERDRGTDHEEVSPPDAAIEIAPRERAEARSKERDQGEQRRQGG